MKTRIQRRLFFLLVNFLTITISGYGQCTGIELVGDPNPICAGASSELTVTWQGCNGSAPSDIIWYEVFNNTTTELFTTQVSNNDKDVFPPNGNYQYYVELVIMENDDPVVVGTSSLVSISVSDPSVSISQIPMTAGCPGTSVTLTANITGEIGNSSYNWGGAGAGNPIVVMPLVSTDYSVTITDAAGCTAIQGDYTVDVLSLPSVGVDVNGGITCANSPLELDACDTGSGNTYMWFPPTDLSSSTSCNPIWTPSGAGDFSYQLTVTSPEGCVNTNTIILTATGQPSADIETPTNVFNVCVGENLELIGSGGNFCLWESPPPSQIIPSNSCNASFSSTVPGDYLVTLTTTTGSCSDTETQLITVNPMPSINATGGVACEGVPIQLNCGAPTAVSYSWSSPMCLDNSNQCDPIFLNSTCTTTDFMVTVTDGFGCTNSDFATVIVHSLPTAGVAITNGEQEVCTGAVVTLMANGGGDYEWNTGETSAGIMPTVTAANSEFVATITNNNGCTDESSITFDVFDQPSIVSVELLDNPSNLVCAGDNFTLIANSGGGIGTALYRLKVNGVFENWQSSPSFETNILETTTFKIEVDYDGFACGSGISNELVITVVATPNPIINGPSEVCKNQQVVYYVNNPTALNSSAFTWTIPDNPETVFANQVQYGPYVFVQWTEAAGPTENISVKESIGSCFGEGGFGITITDEIARDPSTVLYYPFNNLFIVKDSSAQCYQWGFIDTLSGVLEAIPNEVYQSYVAGNAFKENRIYWVKTWDGDCSDDNCSTISFRTETIHDNPFPEEEEKVFTVFPNPNDGRFQLVTNYLQEEKYTLLISDLWGRVVAQREVIPDLGRVNESIDLDRVANGLYIVTLIGKNGKISRDEKIVVAR